MQLQAVPGVILLMALVCHSLMFHIHVYHWLLRNTVSVIQPHSWNGHFYFSYVCDLSLKCVQECRCSSAEDVVLYRVVWNCAFLSVSTSWGVCVLYSHPQSSVCAQNKSKYSDTAGRWLSFVLDMSWWSCCVICWLMLWSCVILPVAVRCGQDTATIGKCFPWKQVTSEEKPSAFSTVKNRENTWSAKCIFVECGCILWSCPAWLF